MPGCTVIPELGYPDVDAAVHWLCQAFQFSLRLRIGDHRAQLNVGEGAVVVMQLRRAGHDGQPPAGISGTHSILVRVDEVDHHHAHAARCGAVILRPPSDYPYGERQYSVRDVGGHLWTFSQSIADVAPEQWGGTTS